MKKFVIYMSMLLLLVGCKYADEICAANAEADQAKVWVFVQFNVPEESDGMESYYYYGVIAESLYEKIGNNMIQQGFIKLTSVRYWGDDDLIHEYKDLENFGDLVFRIEDIQRIKSVQNEPIVGLGVEQFEEPEHDTGTSL